MRSALLTQSSRSLHHRPASISEFSTLSFVLLAQLSQLATPGCCRKTAFRAKPAFCFLLPLDGTDVLVCSDSLQWLASTRTLALYMSETTAHISKKIYQSQLVSQRKRAPWFGPK